MIAAKAVFRCFLSVEGSDTKRDSKLSMFSSDKNLKLKITVLMIRRLEFDFHKPEGTNLF